MLEAIQNVLLSQNAWAAVLIFAMILLSTTVLSKAGFLQVRAGGVQLGGAAAEREIIRQQVEWTRLHYEGWENSMPKPEGYDHWRGRYVAERMIDEVVDWIVYNHISESDAYIEVKQDKIIDILRKYTVKEEFANPRFEEELREDTKKCIKKLIQIRELYRNR